MMDDVRSFLVCFKANTAVTVALDSQPTRFCSREPCPSRSGLCSPGTLVLRYLHHISCMLMILVGNDDDDDDDDGGSVDDDANEDADDAPTAAAVADSDDDFDSSLRRLLSYIRTTTSRLRTRYIYPYVRRCFFVPSPGFCADPVHGVSPTGGLEDISQHASIDIPGIGPHDGEFWVAGWKMVYASDSLAQKKSFPCEFSVHQVEG